MGGLCFEVSVVGAGGYLAEQLVGLHGLYLKVAGRLKIEEFRLGRESCCSVSPATPGSGPRPSAAAGLLRQGLGPTHAGPPGLPLSLAPSPLVQSALSLSRPWGHETSTWDPGEGGWHRPGAHWDHDFGPGPLRLQDTHTLATPRRACPPSVSTGLSGHTAQ